MNARSSLKPILLGSVVFITLAMNLTQTNGTEAPQSAENSIETLQQQRLDVLQQLVEVSFAAYRAGEVNLEQGMQAQQQFLEAKLELAKDRESRQKILTESLHMTAEWEKVANARYRAAQASQADVLQCRANRLKVEITLQRERRKQK